MLEEAKSYVEQEPIFKAQHFNLTKQHHSRDVHQRFKRKPRDGGVREARPNSSKGKTPNILACQAHRIAHKLWTQDRKILALLIQNREAFAVDFHPGAKIGKGILFDHATGVVIGETAVIGDNVSILHGMTLGGTWNITIGEGAKIGSGSVVLKDVPPRTTAVGNPARLIGPTNT
ncbi:hypothetical protein DY000_02049741 [Brassica cretica]|uniref:Serine O-acetyltransferase n=1 Tax=Brassica cretica TaxID=69181 RepID=A0ABQ7F2N3_BRACR|nr:hypothetical protein DY000_02049741 [Brassica cretica]